MMLSVLFSRGIVGQPVCVVIVVVATAHGKDWTPLVENIEIIVMFDRLSAPVRIDRHINLNVSEFQQSPRASTAL